MSENSNNVKDFLKSGWKKIFGQEASVNETLRNDITKMFNALSWDGPDGKKVISDKSGKLFTLETIPYTSYTRDGLVSSCLRNMDNAAVRMRTRWDIPWDRTESLADFMKISSALREVLNTPEEFTKAVEAWEKSEENESRISKQLKTLSSVEDYISRNDRKRGSMALTEISDSYISELLQSAQSASENRNKDFYMARAEKTGRQIVDDYFHARNILDPEHNEKLQGTIDGLFKAIAVDKDGELKHMRADGSVLTAHDLPYTEDFKKELFHDCLFNLDIWLSNMQNEGNSYERRLHYYDKATKLGEGIYDAIEQDRELSEIFYNRGEGVKSDSYMIFVNAVSNKKLVDDMFHSLESPKEPFPAYIPRPLTERDPGLVGARKAIDDNTYLREENLSHEEYPKGIIKEYDKNIARAEEYLRERSAQYFGYVINPLANKEVQGLEGYSSQEIKEIVESYVNEKFGYEDNPILVKGIEVYGSRSRGTANEGSDLDVVVEYEGDWKEDSVFNILHEEALTIDGVKVDINPITKGESGTLMQYMEKVRDYDRGVFASMSKEPERMGIEVKYDRERNLTGYSGFYKEALDKNPSWRDAIQSLYDLADDAYKDMKNYRGEEYGDLLKLGKEYEEAADTLLSRIDATDTWKKEHPDHDYLFAVKRGDLMAAQRMVNQAAERAGYTSSSSYQGSSAFNGVAPWGNGYFMSPEERKTAWDKGELDGDQTLADYINSGVDGMNLDYVALDSRFYRAANEPRKEAILNVRNAIQSKSDTITMYRSVPSTVKEDSFRNGDWISPSKQYAIDNAAVHGWGDDYRIIEQEVPTSEIWWDGNDIAEWGYGREEDYVNDRDFAYKNTANNKKLLDAVVYDDRGEIIPLSKRFNENVGDIRYQTEKRGRRLTADEKALRDTLVDKLRSSGIEVITDREEGQRVLDANNYWARRQTVFHGSGLEFDHFDLSHLGEGAGSQAFGHGVYVSSSEKVARGYARMANQNKILSIKSFGRWIDVEKDDLMYKVVENSMDLIDSRGLRNARVFANKWKEAAETEGMRQHWGKVAEMLDTHTKADFKSRFANQLYEVEIPDDDGRNYLDWDANVTQEQRQRISDTMKATNLDLRTLVTRYPSLHPEDPVLGGNLYDSIADYLGSRQDTSKMLSDAGFVGVKYDAGRYYGGAKKGDKNYVIFNENDIRIKDNVRFFKSLEGVTYGYTIGGKVYIDPKVATAETPIHEYTHLWATALQKGNPREWANVVGMMKDTPIWDEVRKNYINLRTDDEIADEVLATYSGRRGAEKLRNMSAELLKGDLSVAKASTLQRGLFQVQQALNKFWKGVASFLGVHYESAEQVADQVMRDMLNGINPEKHLREFTENRDKEYMQAVKDGDMEKAYGLVKEQAGMMLADNVLAETTDAYSVRKDAMPGETIKVYKTFTLDKDGDPTAMYVSGNDKLPMGIWLDAQDTWHFTAENGKQYVPSTKNPNGRGSRTGTSVPIPSDEVRQQLIDRGFLPKDSKASSIVALAYRPGWHASDLPYFPQGGKQDVESNYGHVHRHNQVVFECELDSGIDYTPLARNQTKAFAKDGKLKLRDADLQWMPRKGFYQYTTNQFLRDEDKGHWYIGGSMRINRALTQEECDRILAENGKPAQEWQQGILDLEKLNYAVSSDNHVKPVLAPVAYDDNGNVVPLSKRFEAMDSGSHYSKIGRERVRAMFIGTKGAAKSDNADIGLVGDLHHRMGMLDLAKTMKKANASARDIKYTTGWELGADDNWKYEVQDIKRFDYYGNMVYEREHPDFQRYQELLQKESDHIFDEGEALRPSESMELDQLREKYEDIQRKLDDNHTLEAYVDAPEVFKAYPDIKMINVELKPLEDSLISRYEHPSIFSSLLDSVDGVNKYGTITLNSKKVNRFTPPEEVGRYLSHEVMHVIQERESFARGGNLSSTREELQKLLNENADHKDYIVSHLKMWASLESTAKKLEMYKQYGSDTEVGKLKRFSWYWDAMNEVDSNMDSKFQLLNDYEGDLGKDKDARQIAESGYHVDEAIVELKRVAQEYKDELSEKDLVDLDRMNRIEKAIDTCSNSELYYNLAGEVEARNVEARYGMTPLQRRGSLATETEDVKRKDQIVILSSPSHEAMAVIPTEGRWRTQGNEEREMYAGYGKVLSEFLMSRVEYGDGVVWSDKASYNYDANGNRITGISNFMLTLMESERNVKHHIYFTEDQIKEKGYDVGYNAKPIKLSLGTQIVNVYDIHSIYEKNARLDSEPGIMARYNDMIGKQEIAIPAVAAFPVDKYPELGIKKSIDDFSDKSSYYKSVCSALVDHMQQKSGISYEQKCEDGLIASISKSMLGMEYGFKGKVPDKGNLQLAARLERDPDYAKDILMKSSALKVRVDTTIEEVVRTYGDGKKLDLRSLTPIDFDVDGNGIVESEENLVADSKQDEGETETTKKHMRLR